MYKKFITLSFLLSVLFTANAYAEEDFLMQQNEVVTKIAKNHNISLRELNRTNKQVNNPNIIYTKDLVRLQKYLSQGQISGVTSNETTDETSFIPEEMVTYDLTNNTTNNNTTNNTNSQNNTSDIEERNTTENTNTDLNITENSINNYEQQVCDLVNKYRQENGLSKVILASDVSNMARVKAEDMASSNYFDHTSPTYGDPFEMMTTFGIDYKYAGENIAKGQKTPDAVMNAWMNSTGHRANILDKRFTELGVGYVQGGGTTYWTQEFITR